MRFYEFNDVEERVILIGVQTSEDEDVAASLDELEELAETAGAVTVAKVIQNREAVHPGWHCMCLMFLHMRNQRRTEYR